MVSCLQCAHFPQSLSFLFTELGVPSGVSPLSRCSHPPGRYKERPSKRCWDSEEAEGPEPDTRHPPAGHGPRPPDPSRALHGVFGSQPGRHKGRVRRGCESLPQPTARRHQEALHPAVGPSLDGAEPGWVCGITSWETFWKKLCFKCGFYVHLEFFSLLRIRKGSFWPSV